MAFGVSFHQKEVQHLRFGTAAFVCTLLTCQPARLSAQTFVQLTDLGQSIGPRLSRTDTRDRLDRNLFGTIGTKVSFIDNNIVYQFVSDPDWRRIILGKKDEWVHSYDNSGGPGGKLGQPMGIDISARKFFYAADRINRRIFVAEFSPSAQNFVNTTVWSAPQFMRPVDVAWDGTSAPLVTDNLYVLDDSLSTITYWNRPTLLWTYGTRGSGPSQFLRPSGICVGKTAAANGGTQFTNYFYVVDRGNKRIAWLNRGQSQPTWIGTQSVAGWDPTDCAVDHFGNVFVVDQANNRLYKFDYSLSLLSTYGNFGKGETALNTFAWPPSISVPCGLKLVNSQTVWYCEGRIITAEQWSDSSGAVEHYLNYEFSLTSGPDTSTKVASIAYRTTDHTRQWVRVIDWNNTNVRWLANGTLTPPGTIGWLWNGLRDDGTWAPPGNYRFRIDIESAYGCGASWCHTTTFTDTFWSNGNTNCGPPQSAQFSRGAVAPVAKQPCLAVGSGTEPATLFLRQRVLLSPQPVTRISGVAASASAELTVTGSGSLSDLVRRYGVRGLIFGITRQAAASAVSLRVYSLGGRPVRLLVNDRLDPGFYEIAWDGLDDRGRPAGPGVYFAVLTVDGQRLMQRLILRETPQ